MPLRGTGDLDRLDPAGWDEATPFDGSSFEPRKLLENAAHPTTLAPAFFAGVRVHALLGGFHHNN